MSVEMVSKVLPLHCPVCHTMPCHVHVQQPLYDAPQTMYIINQMENMYRRFYWGNKGAVKRKARTRERSNRTGRLGSKSVQKKREWNHLSKQWVDSLHFAMIDCHLISLAAIWACVYTISSSVLFKLTTHDVQCTIMQTHNHMHALLN